MSLKHIVRATGLLLALAGCQGTEMASPPSSSPRSIAASFDSVGLRASTSQSPSNSAGHATPVRCSAHLPQVGGSVFGPRGGTLMVGESRLIIPPGALSDTVTITGTALGDGTSTIRFAPHGLHFRHPAVLVLSGEGCALPREGHASIVYVGASGEVLETIDALYLPRWKLVGAPIEHFSGYAIAF